MRLSSLVALAGAALALPLACTFPDMTFVTTTSSSSGQGGAGSSSSTTNATSTGGSTSSTRSTGGAGPGGSGTGGSGTGGSSTSSSSTGGAPPFCMSGDQCDCDADHHRKPSCGDGGAPNHDLGDDCADYDARAFPGQTEYYDTPIDGPREPNTNTYDFNCDGSNTKKWQKQVCNLTTCNTEGWSTATIPACGDHGDLMTCTNLCASKSDEGDTAQRCR